MVSRQQLRIHFRQKRKIASELQAAHTRINDCLIAHPLEGMTHIAGYVAMPEEVALQGFFKHAWLKDQSIYVPVVSDSEMHFYPYMPDTPLSVNTFGIKEPVLENSEPVSPNRLEAVLVPLVAFDATGTRLGMGGGFYDRYFGVLEPDARPLLIGVAFAVQQSAKHLPTEPWDVKLDAVVTEHDFLTFTDKIAKS